MKNLLVLFALSLGACQGFSNAHYKVFGCEHSDVKGGCLPPAEKPQKSLNAEAPSCGPVYKSPCATGEGTITGCPDGNCKEPAPFVEPGTILLEPPKDFGAPPAGELPKTP